MNFSVAHGSISGLRDVEELIAWLNAPGADAPPVVRELLADGGDVFIARAPGRLDVMGGIADYSGSLVLEMPIAEATLVALQRDHASHSQRMVKLVSLAENGLPPLIFAMPLDALAPGGVPLAYDEARAYFRGDPARYWAAYVCGVFLVLMRERGVRFEQGARLLISSCVPEGKGVSSSAALEVAVMSAVAAGYGIELSPRELALLCQTVENHVVGAPCGVMDQMASACGEQGKLLALLCQPAEVQETIMLPPDLAVWGLDSGVRHSVGGGDYGAVRTGAFIGYRMIAELAGLAVATNTEDAPLRVDDHRWHNYLANVTPSEFAGLYAAHLPKEIEGAEFLARFSGLTDAATRVDPQRTYAVRQPTAHAIEEHFRVRAFAGLLRSEAGVRRDELLGELMYQSHESYGRCGLGSEGTDALVRLVREAGTSAGLYGAKITGGGSGGTVAILAQRDSQIAINQVAEAYRQLTNHRPYVFAGSSPGSAAFGFVRLVAKATNH